MMYRVILILCLVVQGGCATLDSMQGSRSLSLSEYSPVLGYDGDDLRLTLGDGAVAKVPTINGNWWSSVRWQGAVGDSYWVVSCDEAKSFNGQRNCNIGLLDQCSWDEGRGRCHGGIQPKVFSRQVVHAPDSIYIEGRQSKLTGVVNGGNVELSFDGSPITTITAISALRSDRYTRLYQGKVGAFSAGIYCRLVSVEVGKTPPLECKAYRDLCCDRYGKSYFGNGFELAVIGKAVVNWSDSAYAEAKAYTERFYQVNRWPRLNPGKPSEVPEMSKSKSRYAELLQREWDEWAE